MLMVIMILIILIELSKIAGGKEAEIEYDISLLNKITEDEILQQNLLSKFVPLILSIAKKAITHGAGNEVDNPFHLLYKTSILSLCKFMCISQKFCKQHLDFLFDLLNSDTDSSLKLNVVAAFGDLINRFPNTIQEKISKFFKW